MDIFDNKNNTDNKPKIVNGVLLASGIVFGVIAATLFLKRKHTISGDAILENVKKTFLADGPIEGSWIELLPVPLAIFSSETDVYYGGISRKENNELVQYEFIADAHTGTILDLYKL